MADERTENQGPPDVEPDKLSIVQWNIEGASRTLALLPRSALAKMDVLILTETWEVKPFNLEGFYAVHSAAVTRAGCGRPSGGVSVLYNQKLGEVTVRLVEENMIVLQSSRCSIVAAYVRPAGTEGTSVLVDKVTRAMHALPSIANPLLVAGDFNTRIDKPDELRTRTLLALLNDFGCRLITDPNAPTFEGFMGSSVIDIFASNVSAESVCYTGKNCPLSEGCNIKWHAPVGVELSLPRRDTPLGKSAGLSRKLDPIRLIPKLTALFPVPREPDVDLYAETLTGVIISSVATRTPRRQRPWFNTSCKLAETANRRARQLAEQYPCMKPLCSILKGWYRRTLETARRQYLEREEEKLIWQATKEPHRWLRRARPPACPISTTTLIEHFRSMYAAQNTIPLTAPSFATAWDEQTSIMRDCLGSDFSAVEVLHALEHLPSNKAAGPDLVRNEHLRQAADMFPFWTSLFNACLRQGRLPGSWSDALLSVIPKGKGDPLRPSSWRAIAKKSCCYKLLALLMTRRLSRFLETCACIPPEQHGFRPGHSTITACDILLREVHHVLRWKGQALYAVYVDFKSAFDTAPRDTILDKLAMCGVPSNVLLLLMAILQENSVSIDDGVTLLPPFAQTTGVAQGDNLSPLLFSLLLNDLPARVQGSTGHVRTLLYADDLVIFGRSRFHVQQALARLSIYVREVGLTINMDKTEAMKFRRGGRFAESDPLHIGGTPLKYVNSFKYLGVTMPTNGRSFTEHITDRTRRALVASVGIKTPSRLSMRTALNLFEIKVAPVASYGIEVIWEFLSATQLEQLDRVKPAFLKRAMGLHCTARNRLVYLLGDTPLFVEDLRRRFSLPVTPAFSEFISVWERKMAEVDPEFYNTGAMINDTWKGTNRLNRHTVTRFAIHGFHHVLCNTTGYHSPDDTCVCVRCGEFCARYHAAECRSVASLNSLQE